MGDVIYIHRQKISKEELLMRCQLVNEGIKALKKIDPPADCEKEKGELADEMNNVLIELFNIKKRLQEIL
ncbi:MAG: hypothetical protein ACNA7Y_02185 [Gammaproteobacteria bacterium]